MSPDVSADRIADFLVGDMVRVRDAQNVTVAFHLHRLDSYFKFCCYRVHVSQAEIKIDMNRARSSLILFVRLMSLSLHFGFSFASAAEVFATLERIFGFGPPLHRCI